MDTLPSEIAAVILSKLRRDGYITEAEALDLYAGPSVRVANYLTDLTAEGIAQYTPYRDAGQHCHAYMYLGGRDPIPWDHSRSLQELKARASR